MVTNLSPTSDLPPNVPHNLVFDYDMYSGPEVTRCPYESLTRLHQYPDIFYTPRNGGHWVVTRQKAAVELLQAPELFSSNPEYCDPAVRMTAVKRVPLDIDPPEHTKYRTILNGMFSPKAVRQDIAPVIRAQAKKLVEKAVARGSCEFVSDIAEHYPSEIFLKLLGIPNGRRAEFVKWVDVVVRSADPAATRETSLKISALIREVIADRRVKPGQDIISRLLEQRVDDRPLNDEELIGICTLLFIGGLDTVVALLSFIMLFLAVNPAHRRELVENPAKMPDGVEEMIRRFSIASVFRYATRNEEFAGIDFRAGERILFVHPIYGIDDREVADPLIVDFNRPISRHTAFGAGPHRCLGSHIGRLELQTFLEEWIGLIPDFEVVGDSQDIVFRGGKIIQPATLPLRWKVVDSQTIGV